MSKRGAKSLGYLALWAILLLLVPALVDAGLWDSVKDKAKDPGKLLKEGVGMRGAQDQTTDSTAARGIEEEEPGAGRYQRDPEAVARIEKQTVSPEEIRTFVKEGNLSPEKKP